MKTNTTIIDAMNAYFDASDGIKYRKDLYPGVKVLVECWNSKSKKSEWLPGVLDCFVNATDRVFRLNVTLDNGTKIYECAPECIKRA